MKLSKLSKECSKVLNKLIETDNRKNNLVCVKVDSKGNKVWTRRNSKQRTK